MLFIGARGEREEVQAWLFPILPPGLTRNSRRQQYCRRCTLCCLSPPTINVLNRAWGHLNPGSLKESKLSTFHCFLASDQITSKPGGLDSIPSPASDTDIQLEVSPALLAHHPKEGGRRTNSYWSSIHHTAGRGASDQETIIRSIFKLMLNCI